MTNKDNFSHQIMSGLGVAGMATATVVAICTGAPYIAGATGLTTIFMAYAAGLTSDYGKNINLPGTDNSVDDKPQP